MTAEDAAFKSLLDYLRDNRGFDFTGYKRSSLERRIRRRMADIEIERFDAYQDHLEVTPDEFTDLFNTILINVTGFFRDKPAWDYVASEVIPQILDEAPAKRELRIWSAACASGEEAYTVAMLFAEALGEFEFKRRVKIYATDIDEEALARARQAVYSRDSLKAIPAELTERYFTQSPLGSMFRPDLRRSVIFGRNNLVQDAPISRIDLLVSRNTLMYFTPEAQARILRHFNFGLRDTGFLFLGKSEMLLTHADLFAPHNVKWRVFRKVARRGLVNRLAFVEEGPAVYGESEGQYSEILKGALDLGPVAQVVVDRRGFLTEANQKARSLFELQPSDIGRPIHDLEISYRPADLRSALEDGYSGGRKVELGRFSWSPRNGEAVTLEIAIVPVSGMDDTVLGATISFEDVTDAARLHDEHKRAKRSLETAYEELQSTVEELETTNEELHSTNEELETTNEELQSSNEELETMNEELQSTNDELEAMNEEQRSRGQELDRVNLFLEGILGSLGVGVVVLDRERRVQVWNANSTDLWGLRPEEVEGESFLGLDMGLPVEELREPLRRVLDGNNSHEEHEIEAVTRRGRQVTARVRMIPLSAAEDDRYGVILLMSVDGRQPAG
jgi:two-component system, chemotaxis family, CheB/CheR fusion protein